MDFTKKLGILGFILIFIGIIALGYQSVTYTTDESVVALKVGKDELNVTKQTEKTVPLPPILSGATILAGVVLIIVARIKNGKK